MSITLNGDSGITTPMYNGATASNQVTPSVNMKNRIINGAMVIDQRNAGAAVTLNNSAYVYPVDRFTCLADTSGTMTAQQSTDAPAGFANSIKFTTTVSAGSLTSAQFAFARQNIEGFNTADLNWGTVNAKAITISFWTKSSLTGTFGGALSNSAGDRSYPFSYTISSANTWEYKTISVAGDTTGTWIGATNGIGMRIQFGLGMGSTYSGTAGAWAGANYWSVTGATSVISTNSATWYVTGVQIEVGSSATSFDYRPYGTELALCQRYYFYRGKTTNASPILISAVAPATSAVFGMIAYPVEMRSTPTITQSGTVYFRSGNSISGDLPVANYASSDANSQGAMLYWSALSGFTAGAGGYVKDNAATGTTQITFSAEL